ncbi:UNVERIFIED_CONTAM: hypothetical protein GTU68_028234 [Idotea baltica]|nr:hypothetical protein [Idotea baltica]
MSKKELIRCTWCGDTELYQAYHDEEWGVPVYDDRTLFEMLNLEGAQAGLSWITVLKKRETYRQAFDQFDPYKIAQYDEVKRQELLQNVGIIRNKLKVNAFIVNAQLFIQMQESEGPSFSEFLWSFVEGSPIINHFKTLKEVPSSTPESEAMSKALKKIGFKFVGSTICYAFMQATGMVNDHTTDCFRYSKV